MKESARAALSYVRTRAEELGLAKNFFAEHDLHLHIPAGAIPKDGPSAGITIATTLISLLCNVAVKRDVAMTGEVTLLGKVLPIGGVKEKILAAVRQDINHIILPKANEKDLVDLPKSVRSKIEVTLVENMDQVLTAALAGKLPLIPGGGRRLRRKASAQTSAVH
jgi:ATP-dependent Lon protease